MCSSLEVGWNTPAPCSAMRSEASQAMLACVIYVYLVWCPEGHQVHADAFVGLFQKCFAEQQVLSDSGAYADIMLGLFGCDLQISQVVEKVGEHGDDDGDVFKAPEEGTKLIVVGRFFV